MLLELADRCEKATGPDRELDAAIVSALLGYGVPTIACADLTASLDAAMSLVPEGWRVCALNQDWETSLWRAQLGPKPSKALIEAFHAGRTVGWETADADNNGQATIATAALALCAAALRAHANSRTAGKE